MEDDKQRSDEDYPEHQPPPAFVPPASAPPPMSGPPQQQPPAPPPQPPGYGAPPPGYGQPPPPGYAPPYPPQPFIQRKTNAFAVASLVLGALWLYWVGSVLALVFGYIGKNQIDNSGDTQDGRGLAIAGIVLGWVGVGVLLIFIIAIAAGA